MASKYFVCKTSDVPSDSAKIVELGKFSLGIFKLHDGFFALMNVCPHKGAALCEGPVCGTTKVTNQNEFVYDRAGEIVRCAWHGWEFDIRTGAFLVDQSIKARAFEVSVDNDDIYVQY